MSNSFQNYKYFQYIFIWRLHLKINEKLTLSFSGNQTNLNLQKHFKTALILIIRSLFIDLHLHLKIPSAIESFLKNPSKIEENSG